MYCKGCGFQISNEEQSCPKCGRVCDSTPKGVANQSTNLQQQNGTDSKHLEDDFALGAPKDTVAYGANYVTKGKHRDKFARQSPKGKRDTLMWIVIVLLSVLVISAIGLGILWLSQGDDIPTHPSVGSQATPSAAVSISPSPSPTVTPTPSPSSTPSPTPSVSPSPTPTASPSPAPTSTPAPAQKVKNPGYVSYKNTKNKYRYMVPSHFVETGTTDSFVAPDGSASVSYYVASTGSKSPATLEKEYMATISSNERDFSYHKSGKNWFAVSGENAQHQGVYYKGLVDGSEVRILKFVVAKIGYWEEYYYDEYIEKLEDEFKRLN